MNLHSSKEKTRAIYHEYMQFTKTRWGVTVISVMCKHLIILLLRRYAYAQNVKLSYFS